jgi:amino acid adenylation domain-containing protein
VSTIVTPTQRVDAQTSGALRSDQTVIDVDAVDASTPSAAVDADPSDAAYIIYTSGSTGRPKGIVHTHASALAYATAAAHTYGLTSTDRFANIAPLHFDQSTFELYCAPLVGAAVLVVPDPILRFPASLSELISREAITVWYSVPYLLGQLSTRGVLDERDLSSLRWVLFGGEAFPPGQLAGLMRQLPEARFSNVYGPAEVNQCTVYHLDRPPTDGEPVPIGVAWDAADLRIVDPDDVDAPMPPGQPGVLLVSSPTMMDRYWERPDLTDAAISTHPGSDGRPTRWYRTGDLVVEHDDGNIEFLGRIDNQIKLRGHRIELEAIDLVLGDIAEVDAATVVVDRPEDGDDRLVALVVAVSGSADHFDLVELVGRTLRSRLPRYAVPSDVRVVDSLPRTATGKVDRTASLRLLP